MLSRLSQQYSVRLYIQFLTYAKKGTQTWGAYTMGTNMGDLALAAQSIAYSSLGVNIQNSYNPTNHLQSYKYLRVDFGLFVSG